MTGLLLAILLAAPRDTQMPFSVYTIRGGPCPAVVPHHVWTKWNIPYKYDDKADWSWQLFRLEGAGPLRHTEATDPAGTWVPEELDTPERRARRARQGNSGLTNYEVYEPERT